MGIRRRRDEVGFGVGDELLMYKLGAPGNGVHALSLFAP
jgi:hypothetical protein